MSTDPSCPSCGRADWVQTVPALCSGGVSVSHEFHTYTGVGLAPSGFVPVIGTASVERSHTSALARALAPEPALLPTEKSTRWGLLLLIPAFLALGPTISTFYREDPEFPRWALLVSAVVFVGALAAPGLMLLSTVSGRRKYNRRIIDARPRAQALWRAGMYCHRCGVAYWPFPPAPDVPARFPLPPEGFRWHVWRTGGYLGPNQTASPVSR